jgi:hypothetical protein
MQRFKMAYLNESKVLIVFKNLEKCYQRKINMTIEETCGLMLEISNDILLDFSKYLEKFVAINTPKPSNFKLKQVKNEENEFVVNVGIFSEVSGFLKACYEVYEILAKQVDDMILPYNLFVKVHQFLARCRLNISNLMFSFKNYYKNYYKDKRMLIKYKIEMERAGFVDDNESGNEGGIVKGGNGREYSDLGDKLKKQFEFKINEESDRKRRLNAVLYRYVNVLFDNLLKCSR